MSFIVWTKGIREVRGGLAQGPRGAVVVARTPGAAMGVKRKGGTDQKDTCRELSRLTHGWWKGARGARFLGPASPRNQLHCHVCLGVWQMQAPCPAGLWERRGHGCLPKTGMLLTVLCQVGRHMYGGF